MSARCGMQALVWLAVLALPAWSQKAAPPRMALIPAGQSWMGSPDGAGPADEHPRHAVLLSAFYIDRYDVTAEQYAACVRAGGCSAPGSAPLCNSGVVVREKDPINCVTWDQARAYCESIGKRLPTEAEWEKAARAGAATKWSFGDNVTGLDAHAWYASNAGGSTHPVGMKAPNQYGLYDMAGNVWQWVSDGYDDHYYQKSPDADPPGPSSSQNRVLRGGSRNNSAVSSRAAIRYWADPGLSSENVGFRCAAGLSG